jgi:hypothetical protein
LTTTRSNQSETHPFSRARFVASCLRLLLAWFTLGFGTAQTQAATEYIYGIGTDWNLYQINVDPVGNTVSATAKINLSGYVSGWGTRNNEFINGLGIDQSTGDIYFNYSYNNNSSSSSGTMTMVPYIYQNVGGSYKAPYALGSAITSATLTATDVGSGWVPRATYYNGNYYAGLQNSDTFLVMPITGTTTKSYSSITSYANWDHASFSVMGGGDFVIGTNNVIYGSTVGTNANFFFRQQLSNATNVAGGASWTNYNVDASLPFATQGAIQVAGLGQSTNLYVISSSGKNVYKVTNFDGSSSPTFSQVGSNGIIPVTMTDLSIIVSSPLPVPEASTVLGGFGIAAGAGLEWFRRRRRQRAKAACDSSEAG